MRRTPTRSGEGAITVGLRLLPTSRAQEKGTARESVSQLLTSSITKSGGIVHATIDGRILDCNDAILRMWDTVRSRNYSALRAPQIHYDPSERDRMLRSLRRGRLSEYEVCFRRKDGSRCWALLNVRLLDAPIGEVGGSIIATVIDITARKAQEENCA